MKQIIPFTKDITFKTNIEEISSISLEDDLILKGEDLISGNFYITGTYKKDKGDIPEEYSYKIPCEIVISDRYDAFDATIDIDNFDYEIKGDTLKINISVLIDNLEEKERSAIEEIEEEDKKEDDRDINIDPVTIINNTTNNILNTKEETYLTYKVYFANEEDTMESIINKFKITKEEFLEYNEDIDINKGKKFVIPSKND